MDSYGIWESNRGTVIHFKPGENRSDSLRIKQVSEATGDEVVHASSFHPPDEHGVVDMIEGVHLTPLYRNLTTDWPAAQLTHHLDLPVYYGRLSNTEPIQ